MKKRVCIFCGANDGRSQHIANQSDELCDLLIQSEYDLVYGGGSTGLMGRIANRFLNAGRNVIGIRPKRLIKTELAHETLSELIVVKDMYERKAKMMDLSELFISLPGGIGTLDELLEVFTHQKIGYIQKVGGILNTDNYYDGLITQLEKMVEFGFLPAIDMDHLKVAQTPELLLKKLGIIDNSTS